ncbi:MAG: NADH-quinone oxidoreductase subunit C [Candidatus Micrarchaeota archaeon]
MKISIRNLIQKLEAQHASHEGQPSPVRVSWVEAGAQKLPGACAECASLGGVFDSAFIFPSAKSSDWIATYVFLLPKFADIALIRAKAKRFYSVSGKIPAAIWDERKMHEISGLEFSGLSDTRPIVIHPESAKYLSLKAAARLPVPKSAGHGGSAPDAAHPEDEKRSGYGRHDDPYPFIGTGEEGEFEIPVGPVHAGIIEPGHFRFHVGGETIHKLEARLSYLHRGIEDFVRHKPMDGVFPVIEQCSGDESVANSVAYAQAAESLAGIAVPAKAESERLILLELERIYSHLADLGGMAMDVGFYSSSSRFLALREDMMRLNARLGGGRFLRGFIAVGGMRKGLGEESVSLIRSSMRGFMSSLAGIEGVTMSSSTFLDRVFSTGIVSHPTAKHLAIVGPGARASAVACDMRKHFAYGAYRSVQVHESMGSGGDVSSRFLVKLSEVKESARLIEHACTQAYESQTIAANVSLAKVPAGLYGLGWTEAPRGSCMFLLRSGKRGTIDRLAIRTASFRNWPALQEAVLGNITADFPLINKSFNLSYAGADL